MAVADLTRVATSATGLAHENYIKGVVDYVGQMTGMAQVFSGKAPPKYQLVGTKMVFAAENKRVNPAQSTGGYLPNNIDKFPITLETTPTRTYSRIEVDNFAVATLKGDGVFEEFMKRKQRQLWEGFELWEREGVHGSSAATVCLANAARSGAGNDELVVKSGYGRANVAPTMHLDVGDRVAVLDTSAADAVLGVYIVSYVTHNTSATTSTIKFTTAISATIAADDKLVRCTTSNTADAHFETEKSKRPLGALDLMDPSAANTSYLGVTEATNARIKPVRVASGDFGPTEIVKFIGQIEAKGRVKVTKDSHVLTAQNNVLHLLAAQILPYQQMNQLGGKLDGGYETVSIAGHDFVFDSDHIPDVIYAWHKPHCHWISLDGDAGVVALDGSAWSRIENYDGVEQYAKKYGQRIMDRRNTSGALTGISTTGADAFDSRPT